MATKQKEKNENEVSLSDWLNAIHMKTDLELTTDNEKYYNPFIINRALAKHQDTVLIADEVNRLKHITKQMAFDFYKNFIPKKRNKWAKWYKEYKGTDQDLKIMEYFNISLAKARNYAKLINQLPNSSEVWEDLDAKLEKGGLKRK